MPLLGGIWLFWLEENMPLDFAHFQIIRDGMLLPDSIYDTSFADLDPGLGSNFHDYFVVAVDIDGNISDTSGTLPVSSRAAVLEEGRVLGINRSGSNSPALVDETITGELIREALVDFNYDYFSDTSSSNPDRANLYTLIDYGLIVIGAESARQDDIANSPTFGGILDHIGYYLSIGGKAIIFGRWGEVGVEDDIVDTVYYPPGGYTAGYRDYFDIAFRVIPYTYIDTSDFSWQSDLIGAHNQLPEYPELIWDSLAASNHIGNMMNVSGITGANFSELYGAEYEIIYTYNSSSDSNLTEGKPVAWRSVGGSHDYVFFDIPLSFMERPAAIAALRQAVGDMGIISDVDDVTDATSLPRSFQLAQNYPNPFNPNTVIEYFNPNRGRTKVTLEVFNILGQQIANLYDDMADPGWNRIEWDGRNNAGETVASGIYFYRLKSGDFTATRKMVLLK
jgi:hypothetical protein